MKNYDVTIGLEIHAELNTKTKMFCGCKNPASSADRDPFRSKPNTNVCPTCLGLPGSLPVPNKQAILDTIKIGKALGSRIAIATKWDRKHYFYPDLPKNFQISQYDQPICAGGHLPISNGKITLTRIHLEEDTGKLTHSKNILASLADINYSLVDLNRAGVPLVELVTEPVIHSAKKAREFCEQYQLVLRTLGVSNADMEKGEMRCEVNISLNQKSKIKNQKLGTKVEIKNLNSFRSVERSIEYEIKRQAEILNKGEKIAQETRGWNDAKQKTYAQRVKETSADYRYFPEPDIPPIATASLQKEIGKLPEMPWQKQDKFRFWGVEEKNIRVIVPNRKMAVFFELASYNTNDKNILANLVINEAGVMRLKPNDMAYIANMMEAGKINRASAKEIISQAKKGARVKNLMSQYQKIDNTSELEKIVKKVVNENSKVVAKIKAGKTEAIAYLVGCVMRKTRGRAEAEEIAKMIKVMI